MLALSPPLFSTFEWPLEDSMIHEQKNCTGNDPFMNYDYRETETPDSVLCFPSSQPQIDLDESRPSNTISGDPAMVKKLNHNASECHRRRKLNSLYSSLRSLLPETDHTKKLSIPNTVSRVLKYIPELQKQVEGLIQRKEEILSSISRQGDQTHLEKQRKGAIRSSLSTVSASQVDNGEFVIQICTFQVNKSPFSEVLLNLEVDGLQVLNASSFASVGERVFYNLHLQMKGTQRMECDALSEKLLSLYETKEVLLP
ncbi:hypothetical protein HHK36_017177 [Tetracentron sinense]|uniref:BHLH domain-containing protein n=1 Tax=Tetracentron sinense TaxID=13715 RepID=A0A834Z2P7_TETSI|nr:hypothetical protein HHK36_017177 [Tetracentron sinense]